MDLWEDCGNLFFQYSSLTSCGKALDALLSSGFPIARPSSSLGGGHVFLRISKEFKVLPLPSLFQLPLCYLTSSAVEAAAPSRPFLVPRPCFVRLSTGCQWMGMGDVSKSHLSCWPPPDLVIRLH